METDERKGLDPFSIEIHLEIDARTDPQPSDASLCRREPIKVPTPSGGWLALFPLPSESGDRILVVVRREGVGDDDQSEFECFYLLLDECLNEIQCRLAPAKNFETVTILTDEGNIEIGRVVKATDWLASLPN